MNVFPCGVLLEMGFDAAGIGNIVFKSYKSLSDLKVFLGANSAIFEAIFKTIDDLNLIDALEWIKKGSSNIGQFAVSLGGKSVDEFLEHLAIKLGKVWETNVNVKTLTVDGITITSYIDSSFNGPALQIIINGVKFKIRLF